MLRGPGKLISLRRREHKMEIEDTIERQSYRDFDLVHLRHGKVEKTRWHISRKEAGMSRSFGYTPSADEARRKIDTLLRVGGHQ
jgi:hypothetical protein